MFCNHTSNQLCRNPRENPYSARMGVSNPFGLSDYDLGYYQFHLPPSPKMGMGRTGGDKLIKGEAGQQIEAPEFKLGQLGGIGYEHDEEHSPELMNVSHQKGLSKFLPRMEVAKMLLSTFCTIYDLYNLVELPYFLVRSQYNNLIFKIDVLKLRE